MSGHQIITSSEWFIDINGQLYPITWAHLVAVGGAVLVLILIFVASLPRKPRT